MSWMNAFGGWPGVATFALMACGLLALPLKFPYYDNLLLIVFSAFTYLLTANSAAYAFGPKEVAQAISNGAAEGDRREILWRARIPWLVGLLGWGALMALSLASLRSVRPAADLPPPAVLAGLATLNCGLAWLTAMLGALIGLNVQTVKGTRDLLRMGLTFLLALIVLAYFVSPDPWRASLSRITRRNGQLAAVLAVSGGFLVLLAELCLRRVLNLLGERRQGLSIL
ncbi:MAG: hypothetical protein HXY18_13680 [Bryobacteraceae bacterium]|nr:hypothetical protein [Bryobacteraceae bacterium]